MQNNKVRVMGHGIDTSLFTPDLRTPREDWLLSVGRLTLSKRHDLAIEMAAKENLELRIAGDGPELNRLKKYAQVVGARVQFLGPLTQKQLLEQYRQAKALVHRSETGSLDKVVLEAVACGLPVWTSEPSLKYLENENAKHVREKHSLQALIPRVLGILSDGKTWRQSS